MRQIESQLIMSPQAIQLDHSRAVAHKRIAEDLGHLAFEIGAIEFEQRQFYAGNILLMGRMNAAPMSDISRLVAEATTCLQVIGLPGISKEDAALAGRRLASAVLDMAGV